MNDPMFFSDQQFTETSLFGKPSFYKDEQVVMCAFTSRACATTTISKRTVAANDGLVTYIVHASVAQPNKIVKLNDSPRRGMIIDITMPPIGNCDSATINAAISESFAGRTTIARGDSSCHYDMRSVLFLLGWYVARACTGRNVQPSGQPVPVDLLSDGTYQSINNAFVISDSMVSNDSDLSTLRCILQEAGLQQAFITESSIGRNVAVYSNITLGKYCSRVAAAMIGNAESFGVGASHIAAYFRGICCVYTLHGHSNEGGASRTWNSLARYPPPVGVCRKANSYTLSGIKYGMETSVLKSARLRNHVMDVLLRGAMCSTVADPGSMIDDVRVPAYLTSTASITNRATDWNGVSALVCSWASNFHHALHKEFGCSGEVVYDFHSFTASLEVNNADHHYQFGMDEEKIMFPCFWVEPSALNSKHELAYTEAARQGTTTTHVYFSGKTVTTAGQYSSAGDVPTPGSVAYIQPSHGTFRSTGCFYINNFAMNRDDGLGSMFEMRTAGTRNYMRLGIVNDTFAVGDTSLQARKWVTPHNCFAHPANGVMLDNHLIRIQYQVPFQFPEIKVFNSLEVHVTVSPLSYSKDVDLGWNNRYGRYMNRAIRRNISGFIPAPVDQFVETALSTFNSVAAVDDGDDDEPDTCGKIHDAARTESPKETFGKKVESKVNPRNNVNMRRRDMGEKPPGTHETRIDASVFREDVIQLERNSTDEDGSNTIPTIRVDQEDKDSKTETDQTITNLLSATIELTTKDAGDEIDEEEVLSTEALDSDEDDDIKV